mmetsp:Transcript_15888/g.23063  ORF Transcript_15888/g.23063 Transcript_15888/m.23063 type:complete len:248 (-) Transcript_15888:1775-2518(-)
MHSAVFLCCLPVRCVPLFSQRFQLGAQSVSALQKFSLFGTISVSLLVIPPYSWNSSKPAVWRQESFRGQLTVVVALVVACVAVVEIDSEVAGAGPAAAEVVFLVESGAILAAGVAVAAFAVPRVELVALGVVSTKDVAAESFGALAEVRAWVFRSSWYFPFHFQHLQNCPFYQTSHYQTPPLFASWSNSCCQCFCSSLCWRSSWNFHPFHFRWSAFHLGYPVHCQDSCFQLLPEHSILLLQTSHLNY